MKPLNELVIDGAELYTYVGWIDPWSSAVPDSPLFKSARLKIKRADKHIDDLKILVRQSPGAPPCTFRQEIDPGTGKTLVYVESVQPVSPDITLCFEDGLQCLRAALDHAMFDIWVADGRKGGDPTAPSFPIFKTAEAYEAKAARREELFSEKTCKVLDSIKPNKTDYKFLWALNHLNNIAKHRSLNATFVTPTFIDYSVILAKGAGHNTNQGIPPFAPIPLPKSLAGKPLKNGEVVCHLPPPTFPNMYDDLRIAALVAIDEPDIPSTIGIDRILLDFRSAAEFVIQELEQSATS